MNPTVTIDARGLEAKLRRLKSHDIPQAMRHTLNDLAFDTRGRIVTEIRKVFDRPTPAVQKLPWVKPQKTNGAPPPELWLTDWYDSKGGLGPSHAVAHHIPGGPVTRSRKGMEKRLEAAGLLGPDEWMMPGAGMKLNQYGNVTGGLAQRMLADIGVLSGPGFTGNTRSDDRYTRGKGGKRRFRAGKKKLYLWAEIGAGPRKTKGIWRIDGPSPVPMMIVATRTPRYAKRFRFHDVALSYAARRVDYHAARAVEQEIARRNR